MNRLEVRSLKVWDSVTGRVLIPNSSFHVQQGKCLAIVGESGSGKSLTSRAIMRLMPKGIRQSGDILLGGENLSELAEHEMRKRRGRNLNLIMQNGMHAFDPSCVVGVPIQETLALHYGWSRSVIEEKMVRAMERVMLKNPIGMMNQYPHQLSGGMLQRAMIALALVLEPEVVIADEPTTALDMISQFEVVEQLIQLRDSIGCAMIWISHDLSVVHQIADEVLVMKEGELVDRGTPQGIFTHAVHPYTRDLAAAKQALTEHFERIMGGGSPAVR
ncbi:staphylopine uptake ABC transporter ATP-binding protein CntD [Paenibacillus sp. MMS18-CY102]|uniref:staphylopine uptake ABC transporter ATP-binding protein CntD n=1 Tax=Paenibacillus sp. MMS18-CY102 TaxID=2682849 RepID=UPI0013659FEB|nr:ABC transporter ATP-binding protein [Paenibacillus sp. MMS18-CY102]MWC28123.1 ATP-binding cassette domain-containing protein [Paenibacillus sp. MMS18-CY102]